MEAVEAEVTLTREVGSLDCRPGRYKGHDFAYHPVLFLIHIEGYLNCIVCFGVTIEPA